MNDKHPLEKEPWNVFGFKRYKGLIVQKIWNGYIVLNKEVTTPEQVDEVIASAQGIIGKSIKS